MFQDLNVRYDNAFHKTSPEEQDLVLLYRKNAVLSLAEEELAFPGCFQLSPEGKSLPLRYAFTLGETRYFLADAGELPESRLVREDAPAPRFLDSRDFRGLGPKAAVFAAAVGESLHRWYGDTRFCGRCGGEMTDSATERARVCPGCGMIQYPKISPAVIAAVRDGDRLLLTKYQGRAFKRYALVAGFHEIGETIEDTVRREVREETGLSVKNVTFYKSQPWVFTDSLLLGFYCDLEGSDAITVETDELSEAGWFHRDSLPEDYSPISLTGEMIDRFRSHRD